MDEKDWVKVIDHTHFYCRSWQYLYFEPRVVQYARIVGTHNTVNKVFHVVALEAVFVQKPFTVERGIIGGQKISVDLKDNLQIIIDCFMSILRHLRNLIFSELFSYC
jgi:BTB/POZ domain-containing protein 9